MHVSEKAVSAERLYAGDGAPEDERMHIVGALVGVDHLEVDQVARHAELVADAVATHHVARHAGDVQRLAAAVAFHDAGGFDNGNGIPRSVIDKIFQPFFTTKPTGQGTGLGLSLSYDIITKGHAGTLEVESEEGAGSVFTIRI